MKPNKGNVFLHDLKAGLIKRRGDGYRFQYYRDYLNLPDARPISLTLPLTPEPYDSEDLFPFFVGLLPEGWYLDLVCRTLKIDPENHFGILLATCGECVGAVGVVPIKDEK